MNSLRLKIEEEHTDNMHQIQQAEALLVDYQSRMYQSTSQLVDYVDRFYRESGERMPDTVSRSFEAGLENYNFELRKKRERLESNRNQVKRNFIKKMDLLSIQEK